MNEKALTLTEFTWELTQRCNLQCKHCGSDCTLSSTGRELSREEALRVVRELEAFQIGRIVFSGGEPLLCPYWRDLAQAFGHRAELGVVTNGTLVTPRTAWELKQYGFVVVSVSVDGLERRHDERRSVGNFKQCMTAIRYIREAGLVPAVNTTVTKTNLPDLPLLREQLLKEGVLSWQIQPAVPSGRMDQHRGDILSTEDIWRMVQFAYESNFAGGTPTVFLAETVGYYSVMETLARKAAYGRETLPVWKGCPAGVRSMGILATGELIGCISLRGEAFRERNVRDLWHDGMTISDYWSHPDAFAWRRKLRPEKLGDKCCDCQYVSYCIGGCSNVRYCFHGTVESGNPMCLYAAE